MHASSQFWTPTTISTVTDIMFTNTPDLHRCEASTDSTNRHHVIPDCADLVRLDMQRAFKT